MLFKRLEELKDEDLQSLFFRETGIQDVLPVVNEILMEVASKGDEALFRYTEKFERAKLDDLRVSLEEIGRCLRGCRGAASRIAGSGGGEHLHLPQ